MLTKPQRELLKTLNARGGTASPYALSYPRASMLERLYKAGLIERGPAPAFDIWNCDLSITAAGRAALADGQEGGRE